MILAVVAKYVSEFSPYQQLVQEFFSAFGFFGRILPSDSSRNHHDIVQVWRHPTHTADECVVTATVVRLKFHSL